MFNVFTKETIKWFAYNCCHEFERRENMRMREMKDIIKTQENTLKNRKRELQELLEDVSNLEAHLEMEDEYLVDKLKEIINKM